MTPSAHKGTTYGCHKHGDQDVIMWHSRGHKAETRGTQMWAGSILLHGLSSRTPHCTPIFCITLQPLHTFSHSGFHKVRSVKCQLHLIFSLFNVSLSPAEAQGTYQEASMCPFLQCSSSLPLWIFIPWAMVEQGRWKWDGKLLTALTYMVLL